MQKSFVQILAVFLLIHPAFALDLRTESNRSLMQILIGSAAFSRYCAGYELDQRMVERYFARLKLGGFDLTEVTNQLIEQAKLEYEKIQRQENICDQADLLAKAHKAGAEVFLRQK